MKKIVTIPLLFSFCYASAGTGGAADSVYLCLAVIAALSFILAVLYSVHFIGKRIREYREKSAAHLAGEADGGDMS